MHTQCSAGPNLDFALEAGAGVGTEGVTLRAICVLVQELDSYNVVVELCFKHTAVGARADGLKNGEVCVTNCEDVLKLLKLLLNCVQLQKLFSQLRVSMVSSTSQAAIEEKDRQSKTDEQHDDDENNQAIAGCTAWPRVKVLAATGGHRQIVLYGLHVAHTLAAIHGAETTIRKTCRTSRCSCQAKGAVNTGCSASSRAVRANGAKSALLLAEI
jgi:hypothetical protein